MFNKIKYSKSCYIDILRQYLYSEMKLAAPHIGNLFDYATSKGIDTFILRKQLTDPKIDVCSIDETLEADEFIKVFEAIIEYDGNKKTGLNYGCYLNIKALGFISQITLNAASLEQAVFILQQYFENSFPLVEMSAKKTKDRFILTLESKVKNVTTRNHLLDAVYCFVYRELKLMVKKESLPLLEMPVKDLESYSRMIGSIVKKGNSHSLVFDTKVLEQEINTQYTRQIEILLPQFLKMLEKKKNTYRPFSRNVRHTILNMCAPELPSLSQVVAQFPLSDRSFQRKLTEEGISYRQISDDIKKELTSYLMKGNKMKTQDIAHILGYSESSAFLHASKRWKLNCI